MIRVGAAALSVREDQAVKILAVGDTAEWLRRGNPLPVNGEYAFCDFDDVTGALLETIDPNVIVSPALAHRFDCIDLATLLCSLSFLGKYRAITTELPNPRMVEREIRQLCPGLDFGILTEA